MAERGVFVGPLVGALGLVVLCSCTAVVLVEGSASVCSNGMDDDGDGMTDCADPSCDGSGVCEGTADTCGNDIDDDHDGLTDCQEAGCQSAGFCDSFVTSCTVQPQGGCPSGMGCYLSSTSGMTLETRCRSAGLGRAGSVCDATTIDALRPSDPHPCAAGSGCLLSTSIGTCGAYCQRDDDCPTGGTCFPQPSITGHPGLCTTACEPRISGMCGAGLACVSFHERGDTYAIGGARWSCADASLAVGLADVGMPCVDGAAPGTPREQICRSSTACIPDTGGATATCRRLCDALAPDCPAGGRCDRLYATGAPSGVGMTVFGVCY